MLRCFSPRKIVGSSNKTGGNLSIPVRKRAHDRNFSVDLLSVHPVHAYIVRVVLDLIFLRIYGHVCVPK
jgi:hypothetical protein